MGQLTEDSVHLMLRYCGQDQHPPLTVWETEQLARAWLEREVLRNERDHARAQANNAVKLLTSIHALLYPDPIKMTDGRTMVFRPSDPDPHTLLQELSERIRALPEQMVAQGVLGDA